MGTDFKRCSESDAQQHENEQDQWELNWDAIFEGVPTAPGTEAAQERHKQLRLQDHLTAEEEAEFNTLFYEIYPQFIPDAHKKRQSSERFADPDMQSPMEEREVVDRQCEITLTLLLLEAVWCWITLLHCGVTFHGLLGCVLVVWCCLIVNHLANKKKPNVPF